MATKSFGKNSCICRDSGSWASPAHIPLIGAKDIKIARKPAGMVDATDRVSASSVIDRTEIPVRQNVEISFNAIWNGGAGLTAIRTAFLAGTAIRLAVLNALPTASGVGLRGDWAVTKFPLKFPLNDGQMLDIALQPHGNYTNAVATYTDATVAAGTAETQATKKLGKGGSVNDSTNAPITAVRDFSFTCEWDLANAPDRGSEFDMVIPTVRKITAELEFMWEESNTQLTAFRTAWEANSAITLSLLDGTYATAGSWGPKADWAITDFPADANLTDGLIYKIKLAPHGNYSTAFTFLTTS